MFVKNDHLFNNALNAINCNDNLSKQIEETIKNIDRQIEALKDSQDYFLSQNQHDDDLKGSFLSQIINGQNMRCIRKPFFSSNSGLIPFTNETSKRRENDGSLDFYEVKRQISKICNDKYVAILKNTISRSIRDIEYNRLKVSRIKRSEKEMYMLKFLSDDDLLKRCDIDMINKIDWFMISANEFNGKLSHDECRRMYDKLINPMFVYTCWTDVENEQLMKITLELGSQGKWVQISQRLTVKRQPFVCFKQWLHLTKRIETSVEWISKEDNLLCDVVKKFQCQKINWNAVSLLVPNRSSKDCERRWNSIQSVLISRPFTPDDDINLLNLIKRCTDQNWSNIAREMDQRSIDECQKRFCEIADELCEWTYWEDRRLWLTLRPYYRQLWEEDRQCLGPTADLTLYESIMKSFNSRCPIVIRFRYSKLCKWFQLWNLFYLQVNSYNIKNGMKTLSLLSDNLEDKTTVMKDLSRILIQSLFYNLVRESLLLTGSKNPDKEAHDLIMMTSEDSKELINNLIVKSDNTKLKNLMCCIIDIKNGNFIPIKFDDYTDYTKTSLKYPNKAQENLNVQSVHIRNFEAKIAVTETIRSKMKLILKNSTIDEDGKKYICKLIDCEGLFTTAFNYAMTSLEKTHSLRLTDKANKIHRLLPDIISRMIDYVYSNERPVLNTYNVRINNCNKSKSKVEIIAELLIYRDLIPSIYKSYLSSEKKDIITKYLPKSIESYLINESSYKITSKNIFKSLASNLKYYESDIINRRTDNSVDMQLITPNQQNLILLRSLFLQKPELLSNGYQEFIKMIRLKYDKPAELINSINKSSVLSDQKYLLLKSRLLSILAIPIISSRITSNECASAGDKLHEIQNDVLSSKVVSKSPNNVVHKPRKVRRRPISLKRKNTIIDEFAESDIPRAFVRKFNNETALNGSCRNNWLKIYLPDKNKSFFVSKSAVQNIIRNNFEIYSINNMNVEEFMTKQ